MRVRALFQDCANIYESPSLENTVIIGVQHILGSIYEMLTFLEGVGLNLSQVFLLGKCYSSSRLSAAEMMEKGIFVSPDSFSFDSHASFDEQFRGYVKDFIKAVFDQVDWHSCERLIILDDGGVLIRELQEVGLPSGTRVIAIEQTSSGYHLVKNSDLKFPVINVARSAAKLKLEPPFIIESFLRRFNEFYPEEVLLERNILILGHGVIGQSLFNSFENHSAQTFDISYAKQDELIPLLGVSDIIIGCSGYTSLPRKLHSYLKQGTTLASLSSSDREFDAVYFRKLFQKSSDPLQSYTANGVTLLQSGFPLNFWGTPHNIPLGDIGITIALLILGIFQSKLQEDFTGKIIELDAHKCLSISKRFNKTPKCH